MENLAQQGRKIMLNEIRDITKQEDEDGMFHQPLTEAQLSRLFSYIEREKNISYERGYKKARSEITQEALNTNYERTN